MSFLSNQPNNDFPEYQNASELSLSHRRGLVFHLLYNLEMQDYEVDIGDLIYYYNVDYGIIIDRDDEIIPFIKEIVKNIDILDKDIIPFLHNWQLERISIIVKIILRYGIFELKEKKHDSKLIINEAVELAKGYAELESYRLVNGVLDNFRKKNNL